MIGALADGSKDPGQIDIFASTYDLRARLRQRCDRP
jgi:hypothetical protein